eukprot:TRINITY_DN2509_c0_g2_i1.p1 TRINITY_DN2509_c0_g2~~TRINITY_DN2509_c0_g2_i1.p1  ORF type:complete len:637 (-),score=76.78 TRINITY_DN2509_c0_g2_i1:453-2249(-)
MLQSGVRKYNIQQDNIQQDRRQLFLQRRRYSKVVPWSTHRLRVVRVSAGIHLDQHALDLFTNIADHVTLAYERVALPCSSMKCGDMIYRSTLDPALRMEQKGIDPRGVALLSAILIYLTATPGVLQGFWDTYILATYQRKFGLKAYTKDDIKIGKQLAKGGFGTVYKATLQQDDGNLRDIIVKKASEFGEAEVWMNERLSRACPQVCAEFITAFEDIQTKSKAPLWLVWQYEGDYTIFDLMQKKDFPFNAEELLFGKSLDIEDELQRKQIVIAQILQQLLDNLRKCHRTGIVHRDVKPQNCIFCQQTSKVKLIDLGAAADLRVGINYVPNEYLLDPRYAPPQNYIMSTQTPRAPPAPIAALLSPVLWRLNSPDRFDMYGVGITMLQIVFPPLRNDNTLIAFRRKLEDFDFDISKWRESMEKRGGREYKEGFQLLDMDDGAGWELLCQLLQPEPEDRPSAAAACNHRFIVGNDLFSKMQDIGRLSRGVTKQLVGNPIAENLGGSQRTGGLTEAELSESLGFADEPQKPRRMVTATIAWWQNRQSDWKEQAAQRQKNLRKKLQSLQQGAKKTISESEQKFGLKLNLFGWGDNKNTQLESD